MKKRCISFIRKSIIAVFCTFTAFSHCLFGYASNDDEYFTITDLDFLQTYSYWAAYGLTANKTYTYTDTYVSTGSVSYNANISLSGTNGISFTGASNNDVLGMIHNFSTDETVYNLVVSSNENVGSINYYGSTNSLNLACTYSNPQTIGGAADSEYQTLTCKDPNFNDAIPYYVTLYGQDGKVRLESYTPDEYAIFRRATDGDYNYENDSDLHLEGLYSFSGSMSVNDSGSLSGSGSISLNTTTTNTNKLQYVLPIMGLFGNTAVHPNGNSDVKFRYILYNSNPFIIAFFSNSIISENSFATIYKVSDNTTITPNTIYNRSSYNIGNRILNVYTTKTNLGSDLLGIQVVNDYNTVVYGENREFIPIYAGYKNRMSDNLYRFLFQSDRLLEAVNKNNELTETGNTESQQKEQALNTQTTQMQNQMTTFQNIEDTAGNNMNTALNNINTNPSLLSTNKFLVSVDWIRQQYNRIVTNTPFEAVITFCLVFGLGLLLLGKVR